MRSSALAIGLVSASLAAVLVAGHAGAQPSGRTEYVLVGRDAFLHASPDRQAEKARDPWRSRYQARLGPYWVLRRMSERNGWVEVATLPEFRAADHCYPTVDGLSGLELRMWVRQDTVAVVTQSLVRRRFDDGSALSLVAGVGLRRRGRGRYEAGVRGGTLTVSLDDSALGRSYSPGEKIAVSRRAVGLLAPGASVGFDGGALEAESASRRQAARSRTVTFSVADTRGGGDGPARATLAVETHGARGNRVRATVRNSCVEVVGQLRERDVTRERPNRPVRELGARRGTALRPGTAIYWPDGSRAGRATDRAALDGSATPSGPRMCFDHPIRPGAAGRPSADDTLTLCVDRTAIQRRSRR